MSNALKYQDLSHTERLEYERIVGQRPASETSAPCDAETPHDKHQPARRRPFLAAATSLGSAVTRLFQRARLTPQATPSWLTLEQFIRRQATKRGYESFDRDSFPHFPPEADPFTQPCRVETDPAKPGYPEALHDIIETFRDAAPAQHLEMLLAYAGRLPELPEELQSSRATMEQVDECMVPLFLSAQLRHGKVYYHLDVPSEAPTMRGFAGLLYVGLNGATPTAIAAASHMTPDLSVVGLDIAKRIFHLVGTDDRGKVILRKRLVRGEVLSFMAQLPPVIVGIEACGGAHEWARQLREQGHDVKLMAPQYVKPYVKTNNNDLHDAEAIAEAVTRPSMRFVPLKEVDQQDIQALHRVRERLMGARTALINEMRGLLAEYGIVLPKGAKAFRKAVVGKLDAERAKLTPLGQELFHRLFDELVKVEAEVAYYEAKLLSIAEAHPECQRLLTIPGIGPLTATALIAAVSDVGVFQNGRQFAAWLGLVPKQYSTGGETRLLGISKRGDRYLRKLLIHGARATLRWAQTRTDRRSQWIRGLLERRGWNRTAVANKNARIVWALLSGGGVYRESIS